MHYLLFLRDIYERKLTLEEADNEQSILVNELKDIDKSIKQVVNKSFLNNIGSFLGAREKVFNDFKSIIFPIKDRIRTPAPEPTPEPALES